jgi:integrase
MYSKRFRNKVHKMAKRKVTPLTDTEVKNAKSKEKDYILPDGNNLHLLVKATASKVWEVRYTVNGKTTKTTIGTYPAVTLAKARQIRDEYKAKAKQGINPTVERKESKQLQKLEDLKAVTTLDSVIDEYLQIIKGGISLKHYQKISRRFEVDISPFIGNNPIDEITHFQLLECIKRIESRGAKTLAKDALSYCEAAWRYAVGMGRTSFNITANIDKKTSFEKTKKKNYPHITDPKEFGGLLKAIDTYNGDYSTKWALKLLPLLFVRPANIRFMEWSEIDFDKCIWSIPADKMKMKAAHIVPLAAQAIEILQEVHKYNGSYKYVFISPVSTIKPLSENTLNMGLMRLGYKDKMVSHGFRHTASTLLHENKEMHGLDSLVIEAQLAHVERNSVKAVYNKAEYLSQRVKLMRWWANHLDTLKAGG